MKRLRLCLSARNFSPTHKFRTILERILTLILRHGTTVRVALLFPAYGHKRHLLRRKGCTMSYESPDQSAYGLLAKTRQAVFGLPHPPPKYAHPWSAYCPTKFQKDDTARNIVPTPATAENLSATDVLSPAVTTADDVHATKTPTQHCERTRTIPESAMCDRGGDSTSVFEAVILELIARQERRKLAAVEASKSSGVQPIRQEAETDFQLPARLHSVSVLNRKASPTGTMSVTKRSGTNRPIRKQIAPKRRLGIEPPAVQRKKRLSAEIIYLKLALNRAEHKQARLLMAA